MERGAVAGGERGGVLLLAEKIFNGCSELPKPPPLPCSDEWLRRVWSVSVGLDRWLPRLLPSLNSPSESSVPLKHVPLGGVLVPASLVCHDAGRRSSIESKEDQELVRRCRGRFCAFLAPGPPPLPFSLPQSRDDSKPRSSTVCTNRREHGAGASKSS